MASNNERPIWKYTARDCIFTANAGMVIGREIETGILNDKLNSGRSEFVAIYGRRRVGKTYLIRNVFAGRFTFRITGLSNATASEQLANFNMVMAEQYPRITRPEADDWMEAFQQIRQVISRSRQKEKVVFIDELPWFDTHKSGFIPALEHFWNSWASARKDVLLIVCGSAASWMISKLINNKGGLHNRVTQRIKLEPFSLHECEQLLQYKKIALDRYQVLQLYMVLGGVPFYWDAIEKGYSAAQNINKLCFTANGLLRDEFGKLFRSLFDDSERHVAIIHALTKKNKGLTRDEIRKACRIHSGGGLSRMLGELEESGFITQYTPFGRKKRNSLYRLSDFFSLFHTKFIGTARKFERNHWLKLIDHPRHRAWSGYAFEQVCLAHIAQINYALGISGVETTTSSWKSAGKSNGAQVDLVIDRRDNVINLCEMKFSLGPFIIDKKYDAELRNKMAVFRRESGSGKSVFMTMITTFGIQPGKYAGNIQNDLDMNSLYLKS